MSHHAKGASVGSAGPSQNLLADDYCGGSKTLLPPTQRASGGTGLLEFHPLANIFPLLEGADFEEQVEDIRVRGVRESIWLYQGKILDGRTLVERISWESPAPDNESAPPEQFGEAAE
jgi:hypothetical protein